VALRSDNLDVEAYCNEQYEFLREARTTTGVTSTLGEVWTNGMQNDGGAPCLVGGSEHLCPNRVKSESRWIKSGRHARNVSDTPKTIGTLCVGLLLANELG
jgi:hypothetical protein